MWAMHRWLPWLAGILVVGLSVPPAATAVSVQEALLRAKPAVALVIVKIGAEVTPSPARAAVSKPLHHPRSMRPPPAGSSTRAVGS